MVCHNESWVVAPSVCSGMLGPWSHKGPFFPRTLGIIWCELLHHWCSSFIYSNFPISSASQTGVVIWLQALIVLPSLNHDILYMHDNVICLFVMILPWWELGNNPGMGVNHPTPSWQMPISEIGIKNYESGRTPGFHPTLIEKWSENQTGWLALPSGTTI